MGELRNGGRLGGSREWLSADSGETLMCRDSSAANGAAKPPSACSSPGRRVRRGRPPGRWGCPVPFRAPFAARLSPRWAWFTPRSPPGWPRCASVNL